MTRLIDDILLLSTIENKTKKKVEKVDLFEVFEEVHEVINYIAKKKNIKVKQDPIRRPYDESIDTQLKMFSNLIDCTSDDDELYCDITYGTKVMSQILTMSVNYGYRIHKNVMLGCMVYGAVNHNTKELAIYDITSLSFMDEIVRLFAENKVSPPPEKIKELLK